MTPFPRPVEGPEVVGIAAVSANGVIGAGDDIPWRIPEDWHRFRRLTLGHVLIMGRKTYDSIGRPLPGRTTVVITRDERWRGDGVRVARSVDEALRLAEELGSDPIYVAGGGEIYRAAWPRLTRLEITEVDRDVEGDVTFPSIDDVWAEVLREQHDGYSFVTYRRRTSSTERARGSGRADSSTGEGTRTLTPEGTGT